MSTTRLQLFYRAVTLGYAGFAVRVYGDLRHRSGQASVLAALVDNDETWSDDRRIRVTSRKASAVVAAVWPLIVADYCYEQL